MRGFASSMENELSQLPEPVKVLQGISAHLPKSYLVANGVFSVFSKWSSPSASAWRAMASDDTVNADCRKLGVMVAWFTACMTRAASGFWQSKDQGAWDWTRWAFAGSFWSSLISLISVSSYMSLESSINDPPNTSEISILTNDRSLV